MRRAPVGTPADARNVPDIGVVYGADIRSCFRWWCLGVEEFVRGRRGEMCMYDVSVGAVSFL